MQLQCDDDDKIFDNLKDITEIYFNAMIFDEHLQSKTVENQPGYEFPKNPPPPSKKIDDDDEVQEWKDMGLDIIINHARKKAFPDENSYSK